MAKIVHFGLTAAAAFIFATCGGNVLANNANADDTPEKTASAGPTKVALITLEKRAYEAPRTRSSGLHFFPISLSGGVRLARSIRHQRQRNTPALIVRSKATLCPTSN
jgi:hypothetical protein